MDDPLFVQHREKDGRVALLLQAQHATGGEQTRFSQYVYPHVHGNDTWLFHLLTKQVVSLPAEVYSALACNLPTMDEQVSEVAKHLFENYFLVAEDLDENAFYLELLGIMDEMFAEPDGITAYTIAPTTACNARCFYCFEDGFSQDTMADETVEATIDFILKNRPENSDIEITWFGGEPLLGMRQIRRICERLTSAGVQFSSSMISNGMLFDDSTIREAKDMWHLERVQVTLDGFEEEHNRRKNARDPHVSAYQLVCENIDRLVDAEVQVHIRLNCDCDNIEEIKSLRGQLVEKYAENEYVIIYLSPLFGMRAASDLAPFAKEVMCWEALQVGCKKPRISVLGGNMLKRNYCMADGIGAVVIGPNGELCDCELIIPERQWGTVFDGCTNPELYKQMKSREPVSEECKGCTFLPVCTTYTRCPNCHLFCKEAFSESVPVEAEMLIERFLGSDAALGGDVAYDACNGA